MRNLLLYFLLLSATLSCSTLDKSALFGHWKNDNWEFVFNEDGSCKVGKDSRFLEGNWSYSVLGNTLEIAKDGKVFLSNLTVKELSEDTLRLEFRNIISNTDQAENIQVLKKVN